MNEQQQVTINGQNYNVDDLSTNCKELVMKVQNGQNSLAVLGTAIELARIGLEVMNIDMVKLLPPIEGIEDADETVVN